MTSKLTAIATRPNASVKLTFGDGSHGTWSAEALIARDTVLTQPLADEAYFARVFIGASALAWPNGLELSPWSLQAQLAEAGLLRRAEAA